VVPELSSLYWKVMAYYLEQTAEDKIFNVSVRQARNIVYSFTEKYLKKRIRPHAIRHSYAVAMLKTTRNLEAVRRRPQRLLNNQGIPRPNTRRPRTRTIKTILPSMK